MTGTENHSRGSTWREFKNKREPAALRVLGLLALLAAGLAVWMAIAGEYLPAAVLLVFGPFFVVTILQPSEIQTKLSTSSRRVLIPESARGRGLGFLGLMIVAAAVGADSKSPSISIVVILLILIAVESRWSLPSAPAYPGSRAGSDPTRRWIWLIAGTATILALWPRSVRLNDSLSTTEVSRMHNNSLGAYQVNSNGDIEPEPINWKAIQPGLTAGEDGLWSRLESRTGLLLSGRGQDSPVARNERSLRTLPWLSGVLTVGFLTLLATAMGNPRAGLAAGLILAMHPEHVGWSGEIGGISTMLMCIVVAMLCVINALQTNRWRWWLGLGAAETGSVFCHSDAAFGLLALNVATVLMLISSKASRRDQDAHVRRLSIAALFVMIPVAAVFIHPTPPPVNTGNFWTVAVSGLYGAELPAGQNGEVWRNWSAWLLLPLGVAGGVVAMTFQDWRTRIVSAALVLAIAAAWSKGGVQSALPYAVLLVPLALAWAGTGLMRLFPAVRRMAFAPLGFALLFVMTSSPALQGALTLPRVPFRELAANLQKFRDANPATVTGTFGYDLRLARTYDPSVRFVDRLETLKQLIDVAYEQDRPLLVYYPVADSTSSDWPRTLQEIATGGRFHLIKEFPAFEPGNGYRLYRYQPREQIIRLNLKPEEK